MNLGHGKENITQNYSTFINKRNVEEGGTEFSTNPKSEEKIKLRRIQMEDMYYFAKVANEHATKIKAATEVSIPETTTNEKKEKFANFIYSSLSLISFALLMGCFFIINLILI